MSFSQGSAREFGQRPQPEDSAKGLSRRAQPKGSARVERGAVTAEWVDAMHLSVTSCRQVLVALHERAYAGNRWDRPLIARGSLHCFSDVRRVASGLNQGVEHEGFARGLSQRAGPEVQPEAQPEAQPEVQPEVQPEAQLEGSIGRFSQMADPEGLTRGLRQSDHPEG